KSSPPSGGQRVCGAVVSWFNSFHDESRVAISRLPSPGAISPIKTKAGRWQTDNTDAATRRSFVSRLTTGSAQAANSRPGASGRTPDAALGASGPSEGRRSWSIAVGTRVTSLADPPLAGANELNQVLEFQR